MCIRDRNAGGSLVAAKGELELFDGKDTVSVGPGFAVNDVIKPKARFVCHNNFSKRAVRLFPLLNLPGL